MEQARVYHVDIHNATTRIMITVTCDKTGVSEEVSGAQIEAREGKKPGEWVWVIKGIEKLTKFGPRPYEPDLGLLLSKQALIDWQQESDIIKEQAKIAYQIAIEGVQTEAQTMKAELQQIKMGTTTNTDPK